jgi:hypothetical protein
MFRTFPLMERSSILLLLESCLQTCMTYNNAQRTVNNSWWWTEECPKRVDFHSKINLRNQCAELVLRQRQIPKFDISFSSTDRLLLTYRVSQEECARLRVGVPYVKVYRYNPKHLYPKLNGYGDNGQRKVWSSCGSTYCTCSADAVPVHCACPWEWNAVNFNTAGYSCAM